MTDADATDGRTRKATERSVAGTKQRGAQVPDNGTQMLRKHERVKGSTKLGSDKGCTLSVTEAKGNEALKKTDWKLSQVL